MPAAAFTLPISIVTSDFSIDKLPRIRSWRSRGMTETRRRRTLGGMIGVRRCSRSVAAWDGGGRR